MIRFRSWRILLLASALVAPLPVVGVVHHHTAVVVQHNRTTVDIQPEIASSTWTKHESKRYGL
jgi:hypothetical protein